jgi:hypothetical protein
MNIAYISVAGRMHVARIRRDGHMHTRCDIIYPAVLCALVISDQQLKAAAAQEQWCRECFGPWASDQEMVYTFVRIVIEYRLTGVLLSSEGNGAETCKL